MALRQSNAMAIFLGHRTAELLLNQPSIGLLDPSPDQELEHCWASQLDFGHVDLSVLESISKPFDILVSSQEELRKWEGMHCHLCTAQLPGGSFIELTQDVFVASPALCLIQRAQELTVPQSIALIERFCGNYTLDKKKKSGITERKPLLTLDDLRSYMDRCHRLRGLAKTRRACFYSLEGSASPMETISRLVFCLPSQFGGFGCPAPLMNYEIGLNDLGRRIVGKDFIRIDLFWKEHDFGIEYQGKYAHSSSTDIAADIARQLAAERKGIQLQMITIEQLREQAQRWEVARKISQNLGVSLPMGKDFQFANQRLVDELISAATS